MMILYKDSAWSRLLTPIGSIKQISHENIWKFYAYHMFSFLVKNLIVAISLILFMVNFRQIKQLLDVQSEKLQPAACI